MRGSRKRHSPFPSARYAHENKQPKYLPLLPTILTIFFIFSELSFSLKSDSYLKGPHIELTNFEHYFFPSNLELLENKNLVLKKMNVTKNCTFCNYTVHNTKPNSTPRDVIICNAIGVAKNVILFVRTLRTTGSKANCVFLLDTKAFNGVSDKTKAIVHACGGQIIDCGMVPFKKKFDGHNYCYVFASYFIELNRDKIDRVIICDMYDTVFQGDPFNEQLAGNKLNIVDEGSNFTTVPGTKNQEWLLAFNFTVPKERYSELYLCSGYIGGKTDVVLKTLKLYLQQHNFGEKRHDQAAFNFLYFSGRLKKNGIDIVDQRQNELIRHISYVEMGEHSSIGDARTIRNVSAFASVIHHYYLNEQLQFSLLKYCPRQDPKLERYLGRARESNIRKWEELIMKGEELKSEEKNQSAPETNIKLPETLQSSNVSEKQKVQMELQETKKAQNITKTEESPKNDQAPITVVNLTLPDKLAKEKKMDEEVEKEVNISALMTPAPTRYKNDDDLEEERIKKQERQKAKDKNKPGAIYKRDENKVIEDPKKKKDKNKGRHGIYDDPDEAEKMLKRRGF